MAATSAGHLQPQQQHQPTQQQQQKINTAATMNGNINRNSPHQPQIHNLQQQQHLMQQYALKQQQQQNYNMQHHMHQHQQQMMQQQQMHQQQLQQQHHMHLKMQHQQQQQMYQNQTSQDAATHMMPCQNYMTPMPQTQNKFTTNGFNNGAPSMQHYPNQFSNNQRSMQQSENLPAGLVNGSCNNNNNTNNINNGRSTCIPPNVVAPSANQNLYPHQNNNNSNMMQQHNNSNMMDQQRPSSHYNQQQQQQQQNQKVSPHTEFKNVNPINTRQQLPVMHTNSKQQHAANNDNNNCNTNCNANCNTNTTGNHFNTNGLNSNGLKSNSNINTISNNNNNDSMLTSEIKANIPPGWRRLTNNNNEIVYISPTGSTLRSPFQIKDYLLSPGTCKCGLPCPLQPEYFFDFNVQVPNTPLTMPTYQNGNDFNSSASNSSTLMAESTATKTMLSPSLHDSSCSLQQTVLTMSATPSGEFVVPPIDTSSSSSLSSSSLCSSSAATIPSATSPSSLTCLHLKRFLDSQQLHAHPMESFNKDVKRRKIANAESLLDNNMANTMTTTTFSPASTTQTTTTLATTERKSLFTNNDNNGAGGQQRTSHNSTFKMLKPLLQQQQHHQQLSNHQQQQQQQNQQQYTITNPTYNNNGVIESVNKTWPKDDRILPATASPAAALTQHETASSHMANSANENVQWSSNLCNKPQGICQAKQQRQTKTTASDVNIKEQQQRQQVDHTSLYKDDLNGYLQQQTTLVHNSMMNLETGQEESMAEADDGELEDDDGEDGQDEGDSEIVEGDEEDDEGEEEKEEVNEQLEMGEILKPTNILADCITNEELEDEMDEQDFNENDAEEEEEEEPLAEGDEEDEEEEEEADNNCESQTVSTEQTVIDKAILNVAKESRIFNTTNTISFYQMPNSQNLTVKQQHFTNTQNVGSPSQTAISNKFSFNTLKNPTKITLSQQQPLQNLFRQQPVKTPIKLIPTAQESPVSSSTVSGSRSTPELQRKTPDNTKKPEQVGAISTSNESPKPCPPSPAGSIESTSSKTSNSKVPPSPIRSPITTLHLKPQQHGTLQKPPPQVRILRHIKNANQIHQTVQQQQPHRLVPTNTSRATVTTIAGNRGAATTTTTTSSSAQRINPTAPSSVNQKIQATVQKVSSNSTTSIPITQLQLQPLLRSNDSTGNSQIIMTSTGQLIVMPSSNNKPQMQQQQQQVIIASGNATTTTQSHATTNVIIQQQGTQQMDVLNNAGQLTTATLQQQSNGGYIVSQATNTQGTATQLQPTTVILNSGQNLITNNGTKVLTNTGNIIHTAGTQPIITTANQLLTTPANAGSTTNVLGQQTVVLNALPNGGYVIQQQPTPQATGQSQQQQQFTTLDSQVVQHLVQQPDGRIIITSQGDPKRRPKKRKTSPSPATHNAANITTQIQPTIPNQTATLLQQHVANLQAAAQPAQATNQPQVVQLTTTPTVNTATTAAYPQQFQLGNGIQGIVVNKPASTTTSAQPQQILLQNSQIIQPMNLIGQQLILPSGLVMAPDTTLLQIQNVGSCGPTTNILTTTPQGTMMLRATSPQTNKQFIQSTTTGQQFIVGSNGQLSPIGQIYSTPMGLVMPANTQHNPTATATFVQQNATIQVQQPHQQVATTPQHITLQALQHQHNQLQSQQQQQQHQQHHVVNNQVGVVLETASSSTTSPNAHLVNLRTTAASPPDTTTHSPRSPERPPSHRSGGSDMVQCVSSSEPDGGTVSPMSTDSRQSPSTTVCEKGIVMSTAYQNTNIYKQTEAKIRRVQTPPQYLVAGGGGGSSSSGTSNATHITGLANMTLQKSHNTANNSQHHHADNGGSNKPDTHDSPHNSPTTTLMITPPPPRTPTPQHQQQQQNLQSSPLAQMTYQQQLQQPQQQQQQLIKTPSKNINLRNRNRSLKTLPRGGVKSLVMVDNTPLSPSSSSPPLAASLQRTFAVGELIWGPARGFPAWPGKVVKILDNQSDSVWVQWFGGGGRSNTEIMAIHLLQSLSEGLEAHHKAQKDTRKSRKLNSQLEKAIQEAMTELDRISATSTTTTLNSGSSKQIQQPTSSTQHQNSPNRANKRPIPRTGGYDLIAGLNSHTSSNVISTTTGSSQPRHKPIRIAPAPPGGANNSPTKSSSSSTATVNQAANSSSTTTSTSK